MNVALGRGPYESQMQCRSFRSLVDSQSSCKPEVPNQGKQHPTIDGLHVEGSARQVTEGGWLPWTEGLVRTPGWVRRLLCRKSGRSDDIAKGCANIFSSTPQESNAAIDCPATDRQSGSRRKLASDAARLASSSESNGTLGILFFAKSGRPRRPSSGNQGRPPLGPGPYAVARRLRSPPTAGTCASDRYRSAKRTKLMPAPFEVTSVPRH